MRFPVRTTAVRVAALTLLGLLPLLLTSVLAPTSPQATAQSGPTLSFSQSSYILKEGERTPRDMFVLSAPTSEYFEAFVDTIAGSATADVDYWHSRFAFEFQPRQTRSGIFLRVLNDAVMEPDETFTLRLVESDSPVPLGAIREATVTIKNAPDYATARLSRKSRHVAEGGSLWVWVYQSHQLDAVSEIEVQLVHNSTDASDFTAGQLDADNKLRVRISAGGQRTGFRIQTFNDALAETEEHFTLKITGATMLNSAKQLLQPDHYQGELRISLRDDEPGIQLNHGGYTVDEGDDLTVEVVLDETRSVDTSVMVEAKPHADSPSAGADDFEAAAKTVIIPAGRYRASATFTTERDNVLDESESFTVAITDVGSSGLPIQWPGAAHVSLRDGSWWVCFESAESVGSAWHVLKNDYTPAWFASYTIHITEKGRRSHLSSDVFTVQYVYNVSGNDTATAAHYYGSGDGRLSLGRIRGHVPYHLIPSRGNPSVAGKFFTVELQGAGLVPPPNPDECHVQHRVNLIYQRPEVSFAKTEYHAWAGEDAVVTLEMIPRQAVYSKRFNVTATSVTGTNAAVAGDDFRAGPYRATIPKNSYWGDLRIPTTNDNEMRYESFELTIEGGGALPNVVWLGDRTTATVTIGPSRDLWPVITIEPYADSIVEGEPVRLRLRSDRPLLRDLNVMVFLSEFRADGVGFRESMRGPVSVAMSQGATEVIYSTGATMLDMSDSDRAIFARLVEIEPTPPSLNLYRVNSTLVSVHVDDSDQD